MTIQSKINEYNFESFQDFINDLNDFNDYIEDLPDNICDDFFYEELIEEYNMFNEYFKMCILPKKIMKEKFTITFPWGFRALPNDIDFESKKNKLLKKAQRFQIFLKINDTKTNNDNFKKLHLKYAHPNTYLEI